MTREPASVGPSDDSVAGAYQRDDPAPAQPAPTLDREALARALHESDMMRRYKDYADRLPTMRPSPVHDLCIEWAAAIADAYEAEP